MNFLGSATPGLVLALLFQIPTPPPKVQINLPDGKGKDVVSRMCVGCHGLEVVINLRITRKAWAAKVDEMVGRGAKGSPEEIALVVDYLANNFGKLVNVNTATAHAIEVGLSLSAQDAAAIVKFREEKGNFKDLHDLTSVPSIDVEKIENEKANIVF